MPAKNVKPVMVYLSLEDKATFQAMANTEQTSLSAVCRRHLAYIAKEIRGKSKEQPDTSNPDMP